MDGSSIDIERVVAEQAKGVADALKRAANSSETEADFRGQAARIFSAAAEQAGIDLSQRDEYTVASGRVDSVYNRLIIEYKRPGILKANNASATNQKVLEQIKGYVTDLAKKEKRNLQRFVGVALDGRLLIFVRPSGDVLRPDDPAVVSPASVERLLRFLFSLASGRALLPENLVEDFGPGLNAQRAVSALYEALKGSKQPLVQRLFDQWRTFFGEATDYGEWSSKIEGKKEFRNFIKGMGLKPEAAEAPRVFFALHTYYALLIKLVASLAAARFAGGAQTPLAKMASQDDEDLLASFTDLEAGGLFRQYGIRNFLEGDFFGWYTVAWNRDIATAARALVQRLSEYDASSLELAPENARDLLKKLYHYLLPREIRHDLGEYYTPDWLAERLVVQTLGESDLGDATKRVVDPACGSGTFLVILMKYIRARAAARGKNPKEVLKLILSNVIGIDLNPLAVIAARTNYLLGLGDLLRHRDGEIDIPVYQADSVMMPGRPAASDKAGQLGFSYEGDVYNLRTAVGEFTVPAVFATRERMDALASELDRAVVAGVNVKAFAVRAAKVAALEPEEAAASEKLLGALYERLRELHDRGLNGVWARIIKNAFAPVFLEPCHYVIGNPPWINWEHLPDDYRLSTKRLWEHYGLFPHAGMDTILGKGKKDISMAMTYVSVDRFLRRGGKLGFVISQSLFKSSGAGQGFRHFELPDGTPFGPVAAEDMLELSPFEGATNRTAILIVAKGKEVRYPVPYSYFVKRETGRGSSVGFDTPYEEVVTNRITFRKWEAEPVDPTDKTSAWITARPKSLRALHRILGHSDYVAHEGSNTGGANAILWLEVLGARPGGMLMVSNLTDGAKKKVAAITVAVEDELVYPLLRGRDVQRWSASPSAHLLMTQDPKNRRGIEISRMETELPKTHAYLKRYEKELRARAAFHRYFRETDPFWSMFNVSEFTFAPCKVVWREVANQIDAAVIGMSSVNERRKPIIPDHTCILAECATKAEAHFLCAMVNSAPARLAVRQYIILHPDPHVLQNIRIPQFSEKDTKHRKLAELSEIAHKVARSEDRESLENAEREIDRIAGEVWGLTEDESKEIALSLKELTL
jgi:methylase of polypeptide subunit release factors